MQVEAGRQLRREFCRRLSWYLIKKIKERTAGEGKVEVEFDQTLQNVRVKVTLNKGQ